MNDFGYGYNAFNNMNSNYDYQLYLARQNEQRLLKKNSVTLGVLLLLYELLCYLSGRAALMIFAYLHDGELVNPFSRPELNELFNKSSIYSTTAFSMGYSSVVVFISVVLLLLTARSFFNIDLRHIYRFEKGQGKTIIRCFPAVMLANLAVSYVIAIISMYFSEAGITIPEADFSYTDTSFLAFFFQILYGVVIAPLAEETIYRGLTIHLLKPYGKGMAVIISSLVFGLMHGNISQAVNAFFFGLVMGTIAVSCNSIVPTIAVHMLNNALAQIPDIAEIMGSDTLYDIYLAFAILMLVLGLLVIFAYHKKIRLPKDEGCVLRHSERYKTAMLSLPMLCYWAFIAYTFIRSFISANL